MPKKAGRVALVLKGDYSNNTSYTILDLVTYNGKSYACKQPATGILPTNTTYWQLMSDPDGGIEVTTMPTASAELVGQVRIYIGQTTSTYTSGQSYQCIEDPENAGVYIWEPTASKVTVDNVTIQENASGQLETVAKIWTGSSADWEALSSAEKSKWTVVNITDDADDASTIESRIQTLTNDIQALTDDVNTNTDNIADDGDEYDSNHNYAVGEYCISPDDGSLQKCVVATSGGSWATVKDTCFTKDSLTNVVKTLNSEFSEMQPISINFENNKTTSASEFNFGTYTNSTGKRLFVSVSYTAFHNNGVPKMMGFANNEGSLHSTTVDGTACISYNGILEAGDTLYFKARYDNNTTNKILVTGFAISQQ